ncbi:MAG: hypothetical protein M5R36_12270 [Deltaproteobacteria bacterium]|nr:hypothetical protein [Deltaproteobacteria bacterium]
MIGWAFGVEGAPLDHENVRVDLRGGYNYRPTPVRNQVGLSNLVDADTHVFSAGIGITLSDFSAVFPGPISFDVFDQFHYMESRIVHKDDPTDEVGDYELGGTANSFGGAMTIRF